MALMTYKIKGHILLSHIAVKATKLVNIDSQQLFLPYLHSPLTHTRGQLCRREQENSSLHLDPPTIKAVFQQGSMHLHLEKHRLHSKLRELKERK